VKFKVLEPERYDLYKKFEYELEATVRGHKWHEELLRRTDIVGKAILFYLLALNNVNGIITPDLKFKVRIPQRRPFDLYESYIPFFKINY